MFYRIVSVFAVVGQVGFAALLVAGAVGLPDAPAALIVTSLVGVASGLLLMIWHLNFRFRGEDRERTMANVVGMDRPPGHGSVSLARRIDRG